MQEACDLHHSVQADMLSIFGYQPGSTWRRNSFSLAPGRILTPGRSTQARLLAAFFKEASSASLAAVFWSCALAWSLVAPSRSFFAKTRSPSAFSCCLEPSSASFSACSRRALPSLIWASASLTPCFAFWTDSLASWIACCACFTRSSASSPRFFAASLASPAALPSSTASAMLSSAVFGSSLPSDAPASFPMPGSITSASLSGACSASAMRAPREEPVDRTGRPGAPARSRAKARPAAASAAATAHARRGREALLGAASPGSDSLSSSTARSPSTVGTREAMAEAPAADR
mmetsp:Transcript_109238/g.305410  ORF Transcript_109238/g.305410 Transcript_109238/m.305410 type:complete len:291 (+) Transcript_109238:1344-2216(+)